MTLKGIILFTGIETVVLAVWLVFALQHGIVAQVIALAILAIGLFFEHLVAFNVGAGKPFFSIPE